MKIKHYFTCILCLLLLHSCSTDKTKIDDSSVISINLDALERVYAVNMSKYFSEVIPIFLETTDESLLGEISDIALVDNHLFILDKRSNNLFVFDKEGKFERKTGNEGKGDKEYLRLSDFTIDRENEIVFLSDVARGRILQFSFEGEYLSSISLDKEKGNVRGHIQYAKEKIFLDVHPSSASDCLIKQINAKTGRVEASLLSAEKYNLSWEDMIYQRGSLINSNSDFGIYAPNKMNVFYKLTDNLAVPYLALSGSQMYTVEDIKRQKSGDRGVERAIEELHDFFETDNLINFKFYPPNYVVDMITYDKKTKSTTYHEGFNDDLTFITECRLSYAQMAIYADSEGLYCTAYANDGLENIKNECRKNNLKLPSVQVEKILKMQDDDNPIIFYYKK